MKAKRGGGEGKGVDRGKLLKNREEKKKNIEYTYLLINIEKFNNVA